jgi:hypothetical protein
MQNDDLIIDLIFKKDASGKILSPELIQVLSAYLVELLKEIQAAEGENE